MKRVVVPATGQFPLRAAGQYVFDAGGMITAPSGSVASAFTRASAGHYQGVSHAANVPRLLRNTQASAVLIEPERTNLYIDSAMTRQTDTTNGTSSIVKVGSLDGGRAGIRWTQGPTANSVSTATFTHSAAIGGKTFTFSFRVKTTLANGAKATITCVSGSTTYYLNAAGTAWQTTAAEFTAIIPATTPLNTWARVVVRLPPFPAGTTQLVIGGFVRTVANFTAELMDFQLEEGENPTAFIPTPSNATATRAADLWRIDTLATMLNKGAPFSVALGIYPVSQRTGSNVYVGARGAGTERLILARSAAAPTGSATISWDTEAGGGSAAALGTELWGRHYLISDGTRLTYWRNGATVIAASDLKATALTQLGIGHDPSNAATTAASAYVALGCAPAGLPGFQPRMMTGYELAHYDAAFATALATLTVPTYF